MARTVARSARHRDRARELNPEDLVSGESGTVGLRTIGPAASIAPAIRLR